MASDTIVITYNADANNYSKGWGKSFELIDSTPGDLAALGLVPNLYSSAEQSSVELQVVNQTTNGTILYMLMATSVFKLDTKELPPQ